MNRRNLLAGLAAVFPVSAAFARPASAAQKSRVVLQVSDDDPRKWNLALNNAENIQADLGKESVQIEIVAFGPGLAMLKADSKVSPRLAGALDKSIDLLACENTMRKTHTPKDELYSGIGFVKSGVTHLIKRQQEGWAYIRP